ncbi:hypothetical protein [Oxynema aestuarii]|uniref:Uncharacterized protein n=1 Tax=Oxynema aestuarii AP17 TaxID=2064643 RepID=A0A6H1TYL9_9CYAN|nr:hypothetical protein [Oxynema aestuarii]QIZ71505.1 hypothetical protein HCG48_13710 [Oxynema aestuarii AP17]
MISPIRTDAVSPAPVSMGSWGDRQKNIIPSDRPIFTGDRRIVKRLSLRGDRP